MALRATYFQTNLLMDPVGIIDSNSCRPYHSVSFILVFNSLFDDEQSHYLDLLDISTCVLWTVDHINKAQF